MGKPNRNIILTLGIHSPNFDDVCVVCKKPCEHSERTPFKSNSSSAMAGSEFVGTREFLVPAHRFPKPCEKILQKDRWILRHIGLLIVLLFAAIAIVCHYLFPKLGDYFWLGLFAVSVLTLAIIIYLGSHIAFDVQELVPDSNYMFEFDDDNYAERFEKLNQLYLQKHS